MESVLIVDQPFGDGVRIVQIQHRAQGGLGQSVCRVSCDGHHKIVIRVARYPDDDFVVAIATDSANALPQATLRPVLDLNDAHAVAEWLVHNQDRFHYSAPEFL